MQQVGCFSNKSEGFIQKYSEIFQRSPLFAGLSPAEITQLLACLNARPRRFAAGQAVTEFIESHSAGSPRRHNDSADFYLGIFFHKMTPLADVFPRFAHKAWYGLSAPCSAAILLNLLYRP